MRQKRCSTLILTLIAAFFAHSQIINTIAGIGTFGYTGDGGPAINAKLSDMYYCNAAIDNAGNIYIAQTSQNTIRKINSAGIITTIAGTVGILGYSGDGGLAVNALLYHPNSLAVDDAGNLYIADQVADVIRKIDPAGIITTITGPTTTNCGVGDGGPLINAQLSSISGLSTDHSGNLYIALYGCHSVRKVNSSGIITTIAGNGSFGFSGDGGPAIAAQLNYPCMVCVDNAGNVYIPDARNHRIRKVNTAGIITTMAGTGTSGYSGDGAPATLAQLSFPGSIVIDNAGNLYTADNNMVVRKIDPGGMITTYAGNGTIGYTGDGGPAILAALSITEAKINIDNNNSIYFADNMNAVIRKITNCLTATISQHPQNVVLCNSGNANFSVTVTNPGSYKWQVNTGSGWNDVTDNATYSGSITNNLTITGATVSMTNYQYRCAVTNTCGTVFSTAAILTVTSPATPTLTIAASTTNICAGATAVFTATPANAGINPSYQWKKNGVNTGANNNSYNDNSLNTGDIITCILTSTSACVTSNTAVSNSIAITVIPLAVPSVTITASNNNFCFGTPVTFTALPVNGGPIPAYTWFKNGVNLFLNSPAYTNNSLNNGDIIMGALGSSLACITSGVVISNEIVVNVTPLVTPGISITATKTSVCKGEPVLFTATPANGGSLPVYQWKKNGTSIGTNNATYSDNNISTGDIITCLLTSNASCSSAPIATSNAVTMTVFSDPVVTLDHTNTLCTGGNRQLDAGNFSSYVWNDGSTGRNLVINTTGTYYVTVTNNNGCKGSDTTKITTLLSLPSGFLPPDTSVCSYGSLLLKAQTGYHNYLWNAGSSASTITITQPGLYWLEVTDNNNCIGKDTVIVLHKDCLNGLYIPNAFTPNNDGKNDSFKPLLFGNVKHYSFNIYNRWGELIFQTKDLLRGWDGTVKGIKQDTNVFIWYCSYQFEGEEKKTEKGTVIIIR
jgi:gliding motility-associated-like protein